MSFNPGTTGPSENVIYYGVDSVGVASGTDGEQARTQWGLNVWGVYPGPTTHGQYAWPVSAIDDLGSLGFQFICYYQGLGVTDSGSGAGVQAGQDDANNAAAVWDNYGWPPNGQYLIVNDIEAASWFANPGGYSDYAVRWCNIVRENGYLPGLYGSPYMLAQLLPILQTTVWIVDADWQYNGLQLGLDPANAPTLAANTYEPKGRAWQYAGNVSLPGIGPTVDLLAVEGGYPLNPAPALVKGGSVIGPPAPVSTPGAEGPGAAGGAANTSGFGGALQYTPGPNPLGGHVPSVVTAWAGLQATVNNVLPTIYSDVIHIRQNMNRNPFVPGLRNNR